MKKQMTSLIAGIVATAWSGALGISVGDQVPDIALPSTGGDSINLRGVAGWKVVYFYPKSFSPGCTKQACGLRDSNSVFEEMEATLFGVSTDNLETQQRFKEKYNLPFDLLADNHKELSRAFDVLGFAGMSKRMTFIINPRGVITDIIGSVSISTHDEDVAELLQKRQDEK